MPIYASNFSSNSLSGTFLVADGYANVSLTTLPYGLEGNKSFVIKIRKGSVTGDVLAASSPITLTDNSTFVNLTANLSSVNEGNLISFTATTANVVDGSLVYYSVFPVTPNVTSSDFVANTGSFIVTNNTGTFALKANADLSLIDETGENFKAQIRGGSVTGNIVYTSSNIAIIDTSKQYTYSSLIENRSNITSGGPDNGVPVTFNLTTINAAGANLYYSMTGNADSSYFITANTGYFIVPANNISTLNFTANTIAGGTVRTFQLLISEEPTGLTKITSNSIIAQGYVPPKPSTVWMVVVAGGARGAPSNGAGGGAGGVAAGNVSITPGTSYTVTVGGEATNSQFGAPAYLVLARGGGTQGTPGGSGGGGGVNGTTSAGSATQPAVPQQSGAIVNYGNPGGAQTTPGGNGGGGGAGSAGSPGSNGSYGSPGGGGITFPSLDMGPAYTTVGSGGGGYYYTGSPPTAVPASAYGSGGNAASASAGQGLVVVSYPTAFQAAATNSGGTYSSSNGKYYYVFTSSGSITF